MSSSLIFKLVFLSLLCGLLASSLDSNNDDGRKVKTSIIEFRLLDFVVFRRQRRK